MAPDRLATVEAQIAWPRGQAEQPVGIRRAKPLERLGQRLGIEHAAVALRFGGDRRRAILHDQRWTRVAVERPQPPILAPAHRLDRGFAAQYASVADGQRPPAQIHHPGFAGRGLDQIAVPGPLQLHALLPRRSQYRAIGMHLVRAEQRPRPRHHDGMIALGATFRDQQMIPAVALVEVRPLGKAKRRTLEDQAAVAEHATRRQVDLLHDDPGETTPARPVVPQHVEQPASAVVVVEQRRVEPAAVEVDGIGPRPVDLLRRDPVIVEITQRRAPRPVDRGLAIAFHVGVDEVEPAVRMAQVRRPDSARIRVAAHVQLACAVERPTHQPPVREVARMVDLDARIPFEGRGRDVVIVAYADDRRVRIEAGEDRVSNGHAGFRIRTQRSAAPTRSSNPSRMKNGW